MPVARRRPWRSRGGLVTVATVVTVVAGLGLTVFGRGAADQAIASFDAASWVWSTTQGELARVNGATAKVDTRVDVAGTRGHYVEVSQSDRFVLLRDRVTGQVSSLDLVSLQVAAKQPTTMGLGVSVALHDDAAFVVDSTQGVVQQIDPRTLAAVGEPMRFPPGITGGLFDGQGRLWVAVPSEGTVTGITAAPLASGAAGGPGARQIRTVAVAAPHHDLMVSALDDGVAVLDRTNQQLTSVRGEARQVVTLNLPGPGLVPARTVGAQVPVTVAADRHVYVVSGQQVREITVPGDGTRLRGAVAWQGRIYCADEQSGRVHVFDTAGQPTGTFDVRGGGPLEMEVRENHLFVNAPDTATARVVDDQHTVKVVDKYADDVLGGDPPPVQPPPPPPPPREPQVGKPDAPRSVTATAGNAEVRVTWGAARANGAAVTRYVVEGGGRSLQVRGDQQSLVVTGLTNGTEYRFTVHAVNSKGAGPSRTSNPVRPTAEVPDPPASVTAEARPDGTVLVRWPAANGQGLDIRRYAVTAVAGSGSTPVGEPDGTELVVKAGALEFGTQYAFSVVSVNERGASSKPSRVSGSVVPFTTPGRPGAVDAATVGNQKGAVKVTWAPSAENGRAVTKYVVKAGSRTVDVTDGTAVTVDGFGSGETVPVSVRAVNEAGESEAGTATAQTVAPPTVTVQSWTATRTEISTSMSVNAGGGTATCTMSVAGKGSSNGACTKLTVGGLLPATGYEVTVTPKNAAGDGKAATKRVETDAVTGKSVCVNNTASSDSAQHTWCNDPKNGMEVFSDTTQNSTRLGRGSNGQTHQAICKGSGQKINDYVYNPGKQGNGENDGTTVWIKIKWGSGTGWMSFAWFNLDGEAKNSTGPLQNC
jgi:hypothetical protein